MSIRLQLAALALVAVCVPLGAVLASGLVMFGTHDFETIALVALASAVGALGAALALGRRILRPLADLRAASSRLAGGDLGARAPQQGPREIQELSASFNEMAASLERLFDARRELVAWASHDLRTPLASLRAMVEALEDDLAEPGEYLEAIRIQTEILSELVEDLFELARIDAGALTLELRDAPLGELILRCISSLEVEARARDVDLEADVSTNPVVRIAPEKVERVLLNLLTNAVRHSPPRGEVAVVVVPDTDYALVSVEDSGDGLSPLAAQRMFERFWRDDASRTGSSGGAGLGLAIARGLVQAHGGTIWAENRDGGGARVAFTLPLAAARSQVPTRA
jgi:two-component system, OmpR family, sensor histidine kinase SaeS